MNHVADPYNRTEQEWWVDHEIARLTGLIVEHSWSGLAYCFLDALRRRPDRYKKLKLCRQLIAFLEQELEEG